MTEIKPIYSKLNTIPKRNHYQKIAIQAMEKLRCINPDDIKNKYDRDRIAYVMGLLEAMVFDDDEVIENGK